VWGLALALLLVRGIVAQGLGLLADEAYYARWTLDLSAGYFDHPPAIAWLIAPGVKGFGTSPLGVRLLPLIAGVLGAALLARHARSRTLWWLLMAGVPLFALGGLFATPDVPLLVGWSLALAAALDGRWTLAGVGVGLAGLGKLTGWGLWPLLLCGAPREWRRMLPGMALTLLLWAPHLGWLQAHDWSSLRFQLGHGLGDSTREAPGWGGGIAFLAAQGGLVTPVLFLAALFWMTRGWRGDRDTRILWWSSAPVLAFFTLAATRATAEANWAAPAWVGALLALTRAGGRFERATWVGGGVALALSAAALFHVRRPLLLLPEDPVDRLGEGRDLAQSVEAWGIPVVYTERYQEAALIWAHEDLDAWALPGVGRPDQYDLWEAPRSAHALFVRPWRGGPDLPTDAICRDRGPSHDVVERDSEGGILRRWQVVEVYDCDPRRPRERAP
jgi:4-amino-4-deoxy-L-arabinose transferase-like glycosyltransferase